MLQMRSNKFVPRKGIKMDIQSIIRNKRNAKELKPEEIRLFISKYHKGEITEAQAGVLLSCIYEKGLTIDEIINFAVAMADSGEKINLTDIGMDVLDEHTTGGVGDKVSLILLPVLASLDIPIAKIASRGMGVTIGVSDKLEAIPGYHTEIPVEDFKKIVKEHKVGILNHSDNLNPVESKIYHLKNQIACSDCIPIIAASLMSLNLSIGSQQIVFEIIYGKGSYIKTKEQAKKLAKILKLIGTKLKKIVKCVIIDMQEPVGYSVGHNLEMCEVIQALKGKMAVDIGESVVTTGSTILALNRNNRNIKENEETIREVLRNGKAYEKFIEMIAAQRRRYKLYRRNIKI